MKRMVLAAAATLCASAPACAQVVPRPDRIGDPLRYLVPAGAAAFSLYGQDGGGLEELGYSLALSQGTTEALKHIVRSRRPDGTGLGFPSGHTSVVFASSTFIHERYGFAPALPFYALSVATAYSRVHTHHHFAKDVVGGALIGSGSAYALTHPLDKNTKASLGVLPDGLAVVLSTKW
ncbi:MAG: phosphoesterase, family [Ramlibacter sp.]|nr:phosphoesterase, family [Ramlibacter sp.]